MGLDDGRSPRIEGEAIKMKLTKSQLKKIIKEELVREASQPTGGVRIGDTVWIRDGSHPLSGRVSAKHKDPRMGHIISVVWYNDNNEMAGQSRHIPSALTTNQPQQASAMDRFVSRLSHAPQIVNATDNKDVKMHLSTLHGMGLNADNILDALRQEVYTADALDTWLESQPQIPSWPLLRNWLDSLGPEKAEDYLQMLIRALHAQRSGDI